MLFIHLIYLYTTRDHLYVAGLGAQMDARQTGDQEVVDSTPATFFCEDFFDHEIFSMVIFSLLLIQEGQLSVSGKRMCTILVNYLED